MSKQKLSKIIESLQPISAESTMFFIQHLGVMVKAGLSLHDALTTLAEEVDGKRFKGIIQEVALNVAQGKTLAESLARHPQIFSELFINMVRSGEVSGKLEDVLKELHLELAKDHTLRSKVRGALIYPTVIVCVMIAIGIFMMTVVMPRLISIFDEIHAPLPLATQVVIAISKFITAHGILVVLAALCVVAGTILFLRNPTGKALFHRGMLRFPILGGIVRKINLARFSRTLSSLLKTDIPFTQALTITGNVLGNTLYRQATLTFATAVKEGITLEALLRKEPRIFPPLVRQMVAVGEKTGSLDTTLEGIADFYEEEVATILETLPALIEPLLIVVLGLGVAGLAVAIIMPMYSLAQQF